MEMQEVILRIRQREEGGAMQKDELRGKYCLEGGLQPFRTGYVIELESGRYFACIKEGRICKAPLEKARHFQTLEAAERFAHRHLGYIGLRVHLCRVCWTLVEAESLEAEWKFLEDQDGCVVKFAAYQDAERYRREKKLQNYSMTELYAFREKALLVA